jgi:2EXR family
MPEPIPTAKMSSRLRSLLEQLSRLAVQDLSAPPIFTCFPDLPLELRNKIWMRACLEPRTFTLAVKTEHKIGRTVQGCLPNPSVLSVNFESREEAKKHYEFCAQSKGNPGAFSLKTCGIYINFGVDRFLISDCSTFFTESPPTLGFFLLRHINAIQSRARQSKGHIFVADISEKVKFVESKVFLLGHNFQGLLEFILHPGLEEFSIVEDDELFEGFRDDGNDCLGGYLWVKKRSQHKLTSTKAFIEEIGAKKAVDISSLRIGCKFVASNSGKDLDLAPIKPEDFEPKPSPNDWESYVDDEFFGGILPRVG